jgi:peroxiredoxin
MKHLKWIPILTVAAAIGLAFAAPQDKVETLALGAAAPMADVKMEDIGGKQYSIKDMAKKNGVLVVFSCNTCPFVVGAQGYGEGWAGRYNGLYTMAKKQGIGMILINSNEGKREGDDSMENMRAHAAKMGYEMPYVVDAGHKVADAFGARTTPHVFLFDANLNLVYRGAIDDNNEDPKAVTEKYLENALTELGSGKAISKPETRNIGCSIKRKS